ncbi:MAG: hypothetical protein Q8M66_04230, partial [Actinomycetota bacterium]|nr:hypothetical protein [Actinomycetota bacterium]
YETNYRNNVSLCKTNAALQDSTLLMSAQYAIDYDGALLLLRSSKNHRYLAMHTSLLPQRIYSWMGDYYWERYTQTLMVYDRQTGITQTIPACFGFSLVENTDQLYYSRAKYGMADLMSMDLTTGQSVMVWDGYYAPNEYSYSIDEIYPRFDGQKVHLKAWRRAQFAD